MVVFRRELPLSLFRGSAGPRARRHKFSPRLLLSCLSCPLSWPTSTPTFIPSILNRAGRFLPHRARSTLYYAASLRGTVAVAGTLTCTSSALPAFLRVISAHMKPTNSRATATTTFGIDLPFSAR